MGAEELNQLLAQLSRQNNNALLNCADEKIPAVDLTAGDNSPKMRVSPEVTEDKMAKMSVQELDEHRSQNRMKVRKVPGVQQGALTVVRATVPQAVVVSETVTEAPTFVSASPAPPRYQPTPFIAPAATPTRLHRVWCWLFAPPPPPTTTDLVQLKRDIKEWTKLQLKINKLEHARRRFAIRSEIARYFFLALTAACYVLIACAALRI